MVASHLDAKKRPTEFRVDRVLQPFDPSKFNFTKVGQEEVLFRFEAGGDGRSRLVERDPVIATNPPNIVAINVSPVEYGHVLLIPRVFECLPQRIDPESFLLALHMAAEAGSPWFRLGYNSLGAFSTINHLHFQVSFPRNIDGIFNLHSPPIPWLWLESRRRGRDGDGAAGVGNEKEKKRQEQSVAFYELFSFADRCDPTLMAAGILGVVVHGSAMPFFFLLISDLINGFCKNQADLGMMTSEDAISEKCSSVWL